MATPYRRSEKRRKQREDNTKIETKIKQDKEDAINRIMDENTDDENIEESTLVANNRIAAEKEYNRRIAEAKEKARKENREKLNWLLGKEIEENRKKEQKYIIFAAILVTLLVFVIVIIMILIGGGCIKTDSGDDED